MPEKTNKIKIIKTTTPLLSRERVDKAIGKKHALKKYDQFALNTSCFWGRTGSNITPVVQFHEIFDTKIMSKLIYYCW